MTKVLITGMSGTGKSTVAGILAARGHTTVDTDTDRWSRWITYDGGDRDWIWREDAIAAVLGGHRDGHLFVAGCKTNQGRYYPDFDQVVLLSAPAEVILARIAARTTNPYGKTAAERAAILDHLRTVEPRLRATANAVVDASAPAEEVARQLEDLAGRS